MIIFMKFDERKKKYFKIPLFLFPWQLRQSLSYRFRFVLAYLVPLDVDVTGNITATICKAWSESFFAPWLPWQRPTPLLPPKKAATQYGGYSFKLS